MGYTRKTDHADDMVGNLLSQDRDQPNTEGLVAALGSEIQALEDSIGDIFDQHFIDNAVGAQLDGLGEIVDESRKGRDDSEYRTAIKAKEASLRSSGSPEDLIRVVRLVEPTVDFELEELFPAHVRINLAFSDCEESELATLLKSARSAGVSGALVCDKSATPFQFSSTPNLEPSVTQGFSQDSQTTGGDFSGAFEF